MMKLPALGLLIVALTYPNTGRCQSFTCDAEAHRPLCPGSVASCMCTTTGKTSFTQWNFPNSNLCLPDNQILLGQYRGSCAVKGLHNCSSFLNAIYVGNGTNCSSSKLIIIGHSSLNGIDIECRDLTSSEAGTLIGNATLDIVSIPEKPILQTVITRINDIAVKLSSPNSTNVTTNLTLTFSNVTYSITNVTNDELMNISGLYENMQYDIVISSRNCAGTSSTAVDVWTLASPPDIAVNHISSVTTNDQIEILWNNMSENVTAFALQIEQDGLAIETVNVYCKKLSCFYSRWVASYPAVYLVHIASINGNGTPGPRISVTTNELKSACTNVQMVIIYESHQFPQTGKFNSIISAKYVLNEDHTEFKCLFLDNSHYYCMVCCSTDPSVPPDSSVYNISTTRGTEVTVDIYSLNHGQIYCKAAATTFNTTDCSGPIVGGSKVLMEYTLKDGTAFGNRSTNSTHIGPFEAWKIIAITLGFFTAFVICMIVLISIVIIKRGCHRNLSTSVDKQDTLVVSYISKTNSMTTVKPDTVLFNFSNPALIESLDQMQDKDSPISGTVPQTVKYTNIHGTFEVTVV